MNPQDLPGELADTPAGQGWAPTGDGYGVMIALAPCFGCGQPFAFDPERVPSISHPEGSPKQPICLRCVKIANPLREANGLQPIVPLPGAYGSYP